MSAHGFLALVRYDPAQLRRKSPCSERSEVLGLIDTALYDSHLTRHISIDADSEAVALLHVARFLIRNRATITEEEAIGFLATSESLLACSLGESVRYD